jgi:hypothetical protein
MIGYFAQPSVSLLALIITGGPTFADYTARGISGGVGEVTIRLNERMGS